MAKKDKETIKKEINIKMNLNDSAYFLLPCLGLKADELLKYGFVNCYLNDKNREKVDNDNIYLYLLFKPDEIQMVSLSAKIESLEEADEEKKVFVEDYDYEGYIVLVLKFPTRFKKDYSRFLKGHYSLFSDEFKDTFPKDKVVEFVDEKDEIQKLSGTSLQYMVITRDPRIQRFVENKLNRDKETGELVPEKYRISLDDCDEIWHVPDTIKEELNINKILENEIRNSEK